VTCMDKGRKRQGVIGDLAMKAYLSVVVKGE
jgi:hypothetical protein